MIIIPFANPLGPHSGPASDGALHSVLPRIAPPVFLSSAVGAVGTKVYRGNADAQSNIAWADVTTAAGNFTADDVAVFDTTNPTHDLLAIAVSSTESLESIDFYQTTAGDFDGTAVAHVYYQNTSGAWVDATNIGTPDLSSTGIKRVTFDLVAGSAIGLSNDLLEPRANPQLRFIFVRFAGVTTVRTAPLFSRIWKRHMPADTRVFINITALANQGESPDFSAYQYQILPLHGDVSFTGFDFPWAKSYVRIVRSREETFRTELIYSKGNGTYGVIDPANIVTNSSVDHEQEILTAAATDPVTWVEDILTPPSDWAPNTIVDNHAVSFTKYWMGWRYIADGAAPALVANVSFEAQPLGGSDVVGVTATEAATYIRAEIFDRSVSPSESRFLIANARTGKSVTLIVPSNAAAAVSTISLPVESGDEIVLQQLTGDATTNIADGFIKLSA
jgi:hypothetical protein